MAHRIEVTRTVPDTRAKVLLDRIQQEGIAATNLALSDVYTTDSDQIPLDRLADALTNPVTQRAVVDGNAVPSGWDVAVEIGFLPGVTDNVGNTTRELADMLTGGTLPDDTGVYTSRVMYVSGELGEKQGKQLGEAQANALIQRITTVLQRQFRQQGGMPVVVPRVDIKREPRMDIVPILEADEAELQRIAKMGIRDYDREVSATEYATLRTRYASNDMKLGDLFQRDGKFFERVRRGPLALPMEYMHAIIEHFRGLDRNPYDLEMEAIAQTWSQHCKHTIFADPIDDIVDGLFKTYIKGATDQVIANHGGKAFWESRFHDNAGGFIFAGKYLIYVKVETHNTPSALDPFGGSITGIVGVDRDDIGAGLGSKPFIHFYFYSLGDPDDTRPLYKGPDFTQLMLSNRRIGDGVVEGVVVGGNCSGIATPLGGWLFDDGIASPPGEGFGGKPNVFVGVGGIAEKETAGRPHHEKKAEPGDYIVMIGGRVGKDGVHGATFSSEAMDTGSPATAVQIGDPITQKKLSDAVVKEARDRRLYNSITDNGAGGLSCSVAEMAKESGGCIVYLHDVPVKYPGMDPWEIWISESQERMTLSVPKEKWAEFQELMVSRGVEATVIGEFTRSGKCVVEYKAATVMDLDLDFLHDGLPQRPMKTTYHTRGGTKEPEFPQPDLTDTLEAMVAAKNIASHAHISTQKDHEVQGGSVTKPLQGRGRVNAGSAVVRPALDLDNAFIWAFGINPWYSRIDTYHMGAAAIDTAVRHVIATGGNLDRMGLLDNFCWSKSDDPERLGMLKACCEAIYDTAVSFGLEYGSGKDSMFNSFKGYNEKGEPIEIAIPPTALISAVGEMENAIKAVTLDAKFAGDLVYVLGDTHDELGASEYYSMMGAKLQGQVFVGNTVPQVDTSVNIPLYHALTDAIDQETVLSAIAVGRGGLGAALAKTAMGGLLGMDISFESLAGTATRDDYALFSESQGRFVVTVAPDLQAKFESAMAGTSTNIIGTMTPGLFTLKGLQGEPVVRTTVDRLHEAYTSTFRGF